uniref:Uncharacterized protein n=1 Tax=Ciona savignyi TaxID=51511 RepID=H2Y6D7_CIOSA
MMKELKSLHPLKPASPPKPSNEIRKIQSELSKLEENLTNLVIVPVIDISRRKAGPYPVGSHSPLEALKDQRMQRKLAESKIHEALMRSKQILAKERSLQTQSRLINFTSPAFASTLTPTQELLVGTIKLPDVDLHSNKISMDEEQFGRLHSMIGHRVTSGVDVR